jgi:uridine phosphorylase
VLIEKALRDEGASYHYLPPSDYSFAEADLIDMFDGVFDGLPVPVYRGASWTTDAPFRETAPAIAHARKRGLLAVEMEAAALYAFAAARRKPVVCFAHVTNRMGRVEGDFEKGIGEGSAGALRIIGVTATTWLSRNQG